MRAEISWPSGATTMSASAVSPGWLSGLMGGSFSAARRRKLSAQRLWMWACRTRR